MGCQSADARQECRAIGRVSRKSRGPLTPLPSGGNNASRYDIVNTGTVDFDDVTVEVQILAPRAGAPGRTVCPVDIGALAIGATQHGSCLVSLVTEDADRHPVGSLGEHKNAGGAVVLAGVVCLVRLRTEIDRSRDRCQPWSDIVPRDHVVEERLAAGRTRAVSLPREDGLHWSSALQDDGGARARRCVLVRRLRDVTADPEQAIDRPCAPRDRRCSRRFPGTRSCAW